MPSSSEGDMLIPGQSIRGHWKIVGKIGGGGFGEIYEAIDSSNNNERVAVKVESSKASKQVLKMEVAVLRRLQGKVHVCKFYGCGRNDRFNYMVMGLQGRNLADLRRESPGQCFSISTGIRLALQVLRAIEDIHSIGFLHRDVKPSNFAIGRTNSTKRCVIMLDFGLARPFLNAKGELRAARNAAGFRGTVRYASITAHQNKEMGRHDDLWSLFYMLVEFLSGSLPWRRIKNKEEVGRMKQEMNGEVLSRGLPDELRLFWRHLETLNYATKPNYSYLANCLKRIVEKQKISMDDPFDWELTPTKMVDDSAASMGRRIGVAARPVRNVLGGAMNANECLKNRNAWTTNTKGAAMDIVSGGCVPLGRTSSDVASRDEFFRHLQVETSLENEHSPPERGSEQEMNVEFIIPLPIRTGRSTSFVNLHQTDGAQETVPRATSTPKMVRMFCRKRSKTRPTNTGGTDVSCTQFAVADDDAISTHLRGSSNIAAVTLVSRWQASFDESEGGECDAIPVESYAEKLSDSKPVLKKESPPSMEKRKCNEPSASRLSPDDKVLPKSSNRGRSRVVFSLGGSGSTEGTNESEKALETNGSIRSGNDNSALMGHMRLIRFNPKDATSTSTAANEKQTTVATKDNDDREVRRLRRYRRRSDCESFRDLVQKMENLSRGFGNTAAASGSTQSFTTGAIVIPPCHRKSCPETKTTQPGSADPPLYRNRNWNQPDKTMSAFRAHSKPFPIPYGSH